MCVTDCNQMECVHGLVGQKGAMDSLFLEVCVEYKNLQVWEQVDILMSKNQVLQVLYLV